jgi:hypothetical protein
MDRHSPARLDSAELKYVVPSGKETIAADALGLDLRELAIGHVYYVDTPELALLSRGIVLRARHKPNGEQDVAVKLRPAPPDLPHGPDLVVELDVGPGLTICTATLKHDCRPGTLERAVAGRRPLRKLLTKRQRELVGDLDWSRARVLGPVSVLKVTTHVPHLGPPLVAQLWRYPDDSSLLELSARVRPRDLAQQSIRFWTLLAQFGLDVAAAQETKSTYSLSLLARETPKVRVIAR